MSIYIISGAEGFNMLKNKKFSMQHKENIKHKAVNIGSSGPERFLKKTLPLIFISAVALLLSSITFVVFAGDTTTEADVDRALAEAGALPPPLAERLRSDCPAATGRGWPALPGIPCTVSRRGLLRPPSARAAAGPSGGTTTCRARAHSARDGDPRGSGARCQQCSDFPAVGDQ